MLTCYAVIHPDPKVLEASTSGGAFSALAGSVLSTGGIVVGAAYDQSLNVRHEIVDSPDGLARLRGVKYVHGLIGRDVYAGMGGALKAGRLVLFTGLPCQAAAVRKIFGDDANLLICDLVCLGAPPHRFWRKYVDWIEAKRGIRLTNINPRDKRHGWGRKPYYRYEWKNGRVERRFGLFDPYAQAFYARLAFNNGCFSCPFKENNNIADITIGDFWGVEKLSLPQDMVKQGVSCVIVRTDKGERIFKDLAVRKWQVTLDQITQENGMILRPATKPINWEAFQSDMKQMSFEALAQKYHLRITPLRHAIRRIITPGKRLIRALISKLVPRHG